MYTAVRALRSYRHVAPDLNVPESAVVLPASELERGEIRPDQTPQTIGHLVPPPRVLYGGRRIPHELTLYVIEHATGYVPSFGLDTTYRSPFDDRLALEENYRDELVAALETSSALSAVDEVWEREIGLLQERHCLLVDSEVDWEKEVDRFEDRLGGRTYRLTIDCERVSMTLARHIEDILDSLTVLRVLSFSGNAQRTGQMNIVEGLTRGMSHAVLANSQHLRHVIWRCLDVDFLPFAPLCPNLEKLSISTAFEYEVDSLREIGGRIPVLPVLHTLLIVISGADSLSANILAVISKWELPALKALTIDSVTTARDLHEFLNTAARDVECLTLTEERNDDIEMVPIPKMARLTQLILPVTTSTLHLQTPFINLQDIGVTGFDYYSLKHRPTRRDHVRALVRLVMIIRDKAKFPSLQRIRLDGLDVAYFNVLRWFPFEEVALNFVSAVLKKRGLSFEDQTDNDLHEMVRKCQMMDGADLDFDMTYDQRF